MTASISFHLWFLSPCIYPLVSVNCYHLCTFCLLFYFCTLFSSFLHVLFQSQHYPSVYTSSTLSSHFLSLSSFLLFGPFTCAIASLCLSVIPLSQPQLATKEGGGERRRSMVATRQDYLQIDEVLRSEDLRLPPS